MITAKENRKHIWFALLLLTALSMICIAFFGSCKPLQVRCNEAGYYQKIDTTIIKTDTIREPFLLVIPGDTVFLSGIVSKPCPDSLEQWQVFTKQINDIFAQNKKYKQTIDFQRNTFSYQLKVASDSLIFYRTNYRELITKQTTQLKPIAAPYPKIPSWCWWVMGSLLVIVIILAGILIAKK
jgi:hypothetical protein